MVHLQPLPMNMTAWVDSWQTQCCGKPFRVSSGVTWKLGAPDPDWLAAVLGAHAETVNAAEEHHGGLPEDAEPTTGQ